jgi:NADPH:quinone reductase-like Zn-dependent oxidoreductase
MKAIISDKYGDPELLQLKEVPKPVLKENEVLVKIRASAVNDYDWSMVTGKPYLYRLFFGIFKPRRPIPGMEMAGIVESVGIKATKFQEGDAVYGDTSDHGFGTFAEYISIHENALTLKPDKMTFEEAAAIPHASMLALQGLVDVGEIKKGDSVLINGAGGGVGTFGLQLAKLFDCEVTGVDTGEKLAMMKSIGFDHIIDYKLEDFTKSGKQYDLILDARTTRAPKSYIRSLKEKGRYVTVGGNSSRLIQILIARKLFKKSVFMVGLRANKDLPYINQLFEEGKIKPIIDGPFTLEQTPQAIKRFGDAKHAGKVIVSIS